MAGRECAQGGTQVVGKLDVENCVVVKGKLWGADVRQNELELVLEGQGQGWNEVGVVRCLKQGCGGGDALWK